jgi:sugar lactone lactonase YvrE
MSIVYANGNRAGKAVTAVLILAVLLLSAAPGHAGDKKKKKQADAAKQAETQKPKIDPADLVWPEPPNIARIRYATYFAGLKFDMSDGKGAKQSWMDRLAGMKPEMDPKLKQRIMPYQLLAPHGLAVDSKGRLYVADQRVGAVFVFDTETHNASLIRNGFEAHFKLVNGAAVDDDDRLFVSDGKLHHVLVFDNKGKVVDQITEGLADPVGLAIDTENRLLYVADTQQDQVMVYDADSFKLLRKIGTAGKNHELTTPGDFSGPTGVAVDADGNVYVTDTMNYRVEIFDGDGKFISQFGRHCDGPGCFAHPKGIAIDHDGHIWVADAMLDLLQVFNRDGELMAFLGGHGHDPGQFMALTNVFVDKQNRVFTSEQYPGRVQVFRYTTDAEAEQQKKEKEEQRANARAAKEQPQPAAASPVAARPDESKPEAKQ